MDILLGVLITSFIIHAFLIVPFVNFLYNLKFFKNHTAVAEEKTDEASVHIRSKARTPEGGGLLILVVTSFIFAFTLPLLRRLGFEITHVYPINDEINIIFFTFVSFGLLGLYDDIIKFFELDRQEGYTGLKTSYKFLIQGVLGLIIGAMMFINLGIDIIHIPFFGVIHFGLWFIPTSAFLIVAFANAVNITDGMDGLASGLLMISLFGFSQTLNRKLSDSFFHLLPSHHSFSKEIVIIDIDEQSIAKYADHPELGQWPWKRGVIAEGLSKLAASHPKVIALDIVFSEASPFPEEDKKLASTIQNINKEIPLMLGYFFYFRESDITHLKANWEKEFAHIFESRITAKISTVREFPEHIPTGLGARSSLPIYADATPHHGFFDISSDRDGTIRKTHLIGKYKDTLFPSFGLRANIE